MRPLPAMIAAIAVVCLSTSARAADIEFHRSLTASGNGTVTVQVCTMSGLIDVHGGNGNAIDISAKIHKSNWHAFGGEAAMKDVAAHPPIQQTGDKIVVGNSSTCSGQQLQNVQIDYEISVPINSTVAAHSGSGSIHMQGIAGFVHAKTDSGDIVANGIGPDSALISGSGTIDIQAAHGSLKAQTASGSLDLRDSKVGDAELRTSSGNITTTNLQGGLRANSAHGNLTIAGLPTADWELETGSGNIHFDADPSAKFNLDAECGSGKITSTLPGTVADHPNNIVKIIVNGGGPEVKMYTSSGNIDLR